MQTLEQTPFLNIRPVKPPSGVPTKKKKQIKVTSSEASTLVVANIAGTISANSLANRCGMSAIAPKALLAKDYFLLLPELSLATTNQYQTLTVTTDTAATAVLIQFRGNGITVPFEGQTYTEVRPLAVILDAGYVLQLQETTGKDISGTRITATQPIAVFGGVTEMRYAVGATNTAIDHVFEQMPVPRFVDNPGVNNPTYVLVRPDINNMAFKYRYQVVAFEAGCGVSLSGAAAKSIDAIGGIIKTNDMTTNTDDHYVTLNKNGMLAQIYISGTDSDLGTSPALESPAMVFPPPDYQWKHKYVVNIPTAAFSPTLTRSTDMVVVAVATIRRQVGDSPTEIAITTNPSLTPAKKIVRTIFDSRTYDLSTQSLVTFSTVHSAPTDTGGNYRPDTDFGLIVLMRSKTTSSCMSAFAPDACYRSTFDVTNSGIRDKTYQPDAKAPVSVCVYH